MTISKRAVISALFIALAAAMPCATARAASLSAQQVVEKLFQRFKEQNIRTMMYEEIRTVSNKMRDKGGQGGMMTLNRDNATTYVMRYFYKAPDRHGYRMLSEPVKNFWPGHPSQENAITMDERWLERVREHYDVSLAADFVYKGRPCYTLILNPKPGQEWTFPMSWYVDKEKFLVLSVTHLVRKGPKNSSFTTGEITYGRVHGFLVPVKAQWKTTVRDMPYQFEFQVRYENYVFNAPLDDSVFKKEPAPKGASGASD
jgi:hypothetical protein